MGTTEFIEEVLFPALDTQDAIASAELALTGVGYDQAIDVVLADGSSFRLTVERPA